ncbi:unnamed protein product [Linum tenue]|uniref:Serpin domain-containing protein n=1 Tax=Linum tenue TaxID=586396 RepID=A0AAV0RLI3_9ROSI|nr:unnamed protein product [Linum tenue]
MELQPDMALVLSKHVLLTEAKNSNAVISPLSIHVVLSLIAAGSKGSTQDQLLSFLQAKSIDHLNSISAKLISVFAEGSASRESPKPSSSFLKGKLIEHFNSIFPKRVPVLAEGSTSRECPELLLANGIWVDKSVHLKRSFKLVVGNVYKAACHEVDFQAKSMNMILVFLNEL